MAVERATLTGSGSHFEVLGFSPDSKLLAAGQVDGTVKIWDVATATEWFTFSQPANVLPDISWAVNGLAFSPNGQTLAWGGHDKAITLLDLKSKKVIAKLEGHEHVVGALAFSPDSKVLATATMGGLVRLWDLASMKPSILFDANKSRLQTAGVSNMILSIAFNPLGKTLAVGLPEALVLLDADVPGKEPVIVGRGERMVVALVFRPDGRELAGMTSRGFTFWDPGSGKELGNVLPGRQGIAYSPDGAMVAVCLPGGVRQRSYMQIWRRDQNLEIAKFECHGNMLTGVAWSRDGKTLATCSWDEVKLWDVATILKDAKK
jgi:WD40 repeat protein